MEQDRYEVSHRLFIIGMISLVACLTFVLFALYILPALLFGWMYDIPAVIFRFVEWLTIDYDFSETASSWIVLLLFLIPGVIFGMIAYYASNKIDNKIFGLDEPIEEQTQILEKKEKEGWGGTTFSLKIIFLLVLVIIVVTLFEWLLSTAA